MRRESRVLLTDMLDAARSITEFTRNKSFDDAQADDQLRSAIYYKFIIIGEALSKLRLEDEAIADQISESPRIIGFRNQIIHGYSIIKDAITWRIIEEKLPILIDELQHLLQ